MSARFLIWPLAIGLCACASDRQGSYGLGPGVATYDAIKTATDACAVQGGRIRLRNGYDGRELANYQCRIDKAGPG